MALSGFVCALGSHPVLWEAEKLVWQWGVARKCGTDGRVQEGLVLSDASLGFLKSWRLPSPCLAGLRPTCLGAGAWKSWSSCCELFFCLDGHPGPGQGHCLSTCSQQCSASGLRLCPWIWCFCESLGLHRWHAPWGQAFSTAHRFGWSSERAVVSVCL